MARFLPLRGQILLKMVKYAIFKCLIAYVFVKPIRLPEGIKMAKYFSLMQVAKMNPNFQITFFCHFNFVFLWNKNTTVIILQLLYPLSTSTPYHNFKIHNLYCNFYFQKNFLVHIIHILTMRF